MSMDLYDLDLDCVDDLRAHGAHVAREGGDKAECPVGPSHPHWSAWQLEWSEARCHMERASGAMGYRTRLMKAEVRRQMEHLPEHQPDPAAEVAPERRRGGFIWHTSNPSNHGSHIHVSINAQPFLKAIEEAAKATAVAFQEAMDAVNAAFASTGTTFQDLQGLLGVASEPAEQSIERRRHGRAAHCPRHGQTKGGTCMKCARGRR